MRGDVNAAANAPTHLVSRNDRLPVDTVLPTRSTFCRTKAARKAKVNVRHVGLADETVSSELQRNMTLGCGVQDGASVSCSR